MADDDKYVTERVHFFLLNCCKRVIVQLCISTETDTENQREGWRTTRNGVTEYFESIGDESLPVEILCARTDHTGRGD